MIGRKPADDAPHQPTAVSSPATIAHFEHRPWLLALVLAVATFVAYQPVWRAGFIWDDGRLITKNRMVQARDALYRIWFTTEAADYHPFTSSFWWLEWRLWGNHPAGYHVVNVVLHIVNVVLVWMVLRRLRVPGAWLAALLFAVHPVNVSTVAWISEQKNTLSMLFYAAAILLYLEFDETRRGRWYGLSLAAFLLALLSKAAVVMLPVVLLGCVWWLRGRPRPQDWLRTAPFFALSILLGLTTVWFEYHRDLNGQLTRAGGLFSRLPVAGVAPWFYLSKAFLPLDLCMVYPQWNPGAWGWSGYLPGIALAGSVALLWWKRTGWGRPLLFGFGYFVVVLSPMLGFFDQGFYQYSMVTDHWQYYSIAGITALAAAGAVALGQRLPRGQQVIGSVAGVVVIVLATLSWQRCRVFRNQETLFRDNLRYNPSAWVAHYNLGVVLQEAGKTEEAIAHYEQALRINPDYADAHCNLGHAMKQAGRIGEAVAHFEQALRINPDDAKAHNDLGIALEQTGKIEEAIAHYERALQINPDYAEAHNNLGVALRRTGKLDEAMAQYEQALRLKPDYADAHNNVGAYLVQTGKIAEAIPHFEQVLRINPDYAEAHYNLGMALVRLGRVPEAIAQYEQALRSNPEDAEAHYNLGIALGQAGRVQEAIPHFEQAVRIEPDYTEAHNDLGIVLAQTGKTNEAIAHFEQALQINPDDAEAHNDLGIVLAPTGKIKEAIAHFEQALRINPDFAEAHYNLGMALALAGRTPEAIKHLQQALRLKPDFTPAQNALAQLQATK